MRFVDAQSLTQPRSRSSPNRRQDFSSRLHSLLSILFKLNNLYLHTQSMVKQWSVEAQLLKRPLRSRLRLPVNIRYELNRFLEVAMVNRFLQTSLDAAVMVHICTATQTSQREEARIAEDLGDQEEQEVQEAQAGQMAAASEEAAALAAASADQEALDGQTAQEDQEVQEEAAVREDLEVQDTQVGQVVLEDRVADRRLLPRHMARAPQQQLTEHHET